MLVAMRGLQAVGASMLFANSPAILTKTFPPEQRGRALGAQATMTYLGLTVGPPLGGWLADAFGWPSIFFINLPIGALAIALAVSFVVNDRPETIRERFDWAGAALFSGGLVLLLVGLDQGHAWGWTSASTVACLTTALALLAAFVRLETRQTNPMLDLSLFRNRTFASSVAAALLTYVASYSGIFALPFLLVQGRGLSTAQAGLMMATQPLVMAIVAPVSGAASDRIGPRLLTTTGMFCRGSRVLPLGDVRTTDLACSRRGPPDVRRLGHWSFHVAEQQRADGLRAAPSSRHRGRRARTGAQSWNGAWCRNYGSSVHDIPRAGGGHPRRARLGHSGESLRGRGGGDRRCVDLPDARLSPNPGTKRRAGSGRLPPKRVTFGLLLIKPEGVDMHGQFIWYELTTPDVNAAQKFYPRFTGWGTQKFDNDYTMWTNGGTPIGGIFRLNDEMRAKGVPPNWMPYVETNDVDESARLATSLGGTVIVPAADIPGTGRYAVVQDPQGAVFGLYKPAGASIAWDGNPVVGRFSWHELMTTDWKKAFEFYQKLFGWDKQSEMDMGGGNMYAMFGKNQMFGGMFDRQPEMASMHPFWLCYINVKDVGKAVEAATKAGAFVQRPRMDIPGGTIAILGDPQGAGFALHDQMVGAAGSNWTPETGAKRSSASGGAAKKATKKAAKPATKKAAKPAKKAKPKPKAAAKKRPVAKKKPAKKAAKKSTRKAAKKRR
jgi:predicted enzyme related to lactoylglutathione lyase/MFS family permease